MHIFAILALVFSIAAPQAQAGVVVSVWSPGVAVFDPYDPGYAPAPRADYIWFPGRYDEYGYFIPGYWKPVAPRVGFLWAPGYWVGRRYHEGYWRPEAQSGRAWIDGYYVRGTYVRPYWVHADQADRAHARAKSHLRSREYSHTKGHHHPR